jgi:hypothetical protein
MKNGQNAANGELMKNDERTAGVQKIAAKYGYRVE